MYLYIIIIINDPIHYLWLFKALHSIFLRSFSSLMFNTQSSWFFPTVSTVLLMVLSYHFMQALSHFSILKVLIRAMLNFLDNVTSCFEIFTIFIKKKKLGSTFLMVTDFSIRCACFCATKKYRIFMPFEKLFWYHW